ncbi:MAG TPA: hypothetical protein DDW50_05170 [Firmicutes bacterium]|nr:hypothetical protein [Bacillota bacterium]
MYNLTKFGKILFLKTLFVKNIHGIELISKICYPITMINGFYKSAIPCIRFEEKYLLKITGPNSTWILLFYYLILTL